MFYIIPSSLYRCGDMVGVKVKGMFHKATDMKFLNGTALEVVF